MSKITINTQSANRISINTPQKQDIISVKSTGFNGAGANGYNRLVELIDVDATDLDTNETLVYDVTTGKFVVSTLPIIDGGIF